MAKKTITVTLHMSELIYDVQNKTYLTGRSRLNPDGGNQELVANMQANNDDENANQVMRSIGNAYDNLKVKLAEYLVDDGTTSDDKLMTANSNLTISLVMPSNYNQSVNDTISSAAHQYIVNTAIGDWFIITNKADATDYMTLAAANLGQIREAINKRVRPVREEVL